MAGRLSLLCQDVIQSIDPSDTGGSSTAVSPHAAPGREANSARSKYTMQMPPDAGGGGGLTSRAVAAAAAAGGAGAASPRSPKQGADIARAGDPSSPAAAAATAVNVPGLKLAASHNNNTFGKGGPGRPQKQQIRPAQGELTSRSAEHPVSSMHKGASTSTAAGAGAKVALTVRAGQGVSGAASVSSAAVAAAARASCISNNQNQQSPSSSPVPRAAGTSPAPAAAASGAGMRMRAAVGSEGGARRVLNASPMARTSCVTPAEAVTAKVAGVRQQRDAAVSPNSRQHGRGAGDGKEASKNEKARLSQHQWSVRSCLAAAGQGWLQQKVAAQEKPGSKGGGKLEGTVMQKCY